MIFKRDTATALHHFFTDKGLSLSCAESCTGGLIAKKMTDKAGSSKFFLGGVVSYHDSVKTAVLGVRKKTLLKFGAVSAECAIEMAQGIKSKTGSGISVSVTGIAGPSGGSRHKPVGTVYAAFCIGKDLVVKHFTFKGSRRAIREKAADHVLKTLFQLIRTEKN